MDYITIKDDDDDEINSIDSLSISSIENHFSDGNNIDRITSTMISYDIVPVPAPLEHTNGPTENMALLNVILVNPQDTEQFQKPTAVRRNFFCTLNSEIVPIRSALADDNGAYMAAGRAKKLYLAKFDVG